MCEDMLAESVTWLDETLGIAAPERHEKLQEGRDLAQRLRSAAIGLSYSKRTEFSPNIERLIVMAAKVALVSFGPQSSTLDSYERPLDVYRTLDGGSALVKDYDAFKRRFRDNDS